MSYALRLLVGAMGLMILITLNIGGFSLWKLFYHLPLASAIRAMTRLDQVLLFPVGALAMIALDHLRQLVGRGTALALLSLILAASVTEMTLHKSPSTAKALWRERISTAEAKLPQDLPADAILFMAQGRGPFEAEEVDAMWVALRHGIVTANGYSGSVPNGASWRFGADCTEFSNRILGYQTMMASPDPEAAYHRFVDRLVLVGFGACDRTKLQKRPQFSTSDRIYTPEEVRHLAYEITRLDQTAGAAVVTVTNTADFAFAAKSALDRPLRISWRFRDAAGQPMSDWDVRRDLPADIPAHGSLEISLPLQIPAGAASLEVSMVQELEFWLQDMGVPSATIALP
jgi:hypothetical protein